MTTITVKKLVWEASKSTPRAKDLSWWWAESATGPYSIRRRKKYWLLRDYSEVVTKSWFDTLEEAQAVAQADFEKRVLSALDTEDKP